MPTAGEGSGKGPPLEPNGGDFLSGIDRKKAEDVKRSEINQAVIRAQQALEAIHFKLPGFAHWGPKQWKENKEKTGNIKEVMLGWDVTDFGSNDFLHTGAVLFTLRNGSLYNSDAGVPYCEKVIVFTDQEKQVIPFHFHRNKTEDIINRGNGIMEIELYNSTSDGKIDVCGDIEVYMDGILHIVKAGEIFEITPGNSITLAPLIYHRFGAKKGAGCLVAGEVSKINDDNKDNVFAEEQKRFSDIVEDEPMLHPLCNEYERCV